MGNETYYKLRKSDDSDSIQLEEVLETESPEVEKVKMSVSNKALIVSIVAVVLFNWFQSTVTHFENDFKLIKLVFYLTKIVVPSLFRLIQLLNHHLDVFWLKSKN